MELGRGIRSDQAVRRLLVRHPHRHCRLFCKLASFVALLLLPVVVVVVVEEGLVLGSGQVKTGKTEASQEGNAFRDDDQLDLTRPFLLLSFYLYTTYTLTTTYALILVFVI